MLTVSRIWKARLDRMIRLNKYYVPAVIAAVSLIVVGASTGCDSGPVTPRVTSQTSEVTLAPGAEVSIGGDNVKFTVRRSNSDVLKITAVLTDAAHVQYFVLPRSEPPVNDLDINATLKLGAAPDAGADLTIEIPDGINFRINVSNGDIDVEGISVIESNLVTTSGDVSLRSSKGSFTLNSENGDLVMTGSEGTFWTGTSNGQITFDGTITNAAQSRFVNSNGSVDLKLRGQPDLTMAVRTANGSFEVPDAEYVREDRGFTYLRYGLGVGFMEIDIKIGNAKIALAAE